MGAAAPQPRSAAAQRRRGRQPAMERLWIMKPLAFAVIALAAPGAAFAQADSAIAGPSGDALARDRLAGCLALARDDPASAAAEAESWRREITAGSRALPLQCLGTAHATRQQWDAAEAAFTQAAEDVAARPGGDTRLRADLLTQAGNAALAAGKGERALGHLDAAMGALGTEGPAPARAALAIDRARALVLLSREGAAAAALDEAKTLDPQSADAFLLAATLSRRRGDLAAAARDIAIADRLAPGDPAILLEAGAIAALAGDTASARDAWERVVAGGGGSDIGAEHAAMAARAYLAQLDEVAPPVPAAGGNDAAPADPEPAR